MEEHSRTTQGSQILFAFLHGFVLLCMSMSIPLESATLPPRASGGTFGNETDRAALLDLKKRITQDPLHVMNSWNDSIHFCSWVGVTCNNSTKRVLILMLNSKNLVGSLPPSIGNLSHLTGINLVNNRFSGEIPQEMGRLQSLRSLNLSYNSFGGKIPTNISHCTLLSMLDLQHNEITGSIPDQLSSLMSLNHLWLTINNLTGTIPNWIGNFSSLKSLFLGQNNFQGSIPNELGRLTGLEWFGLDSNNLSGMVPSSIYNISSMYVFSVFDNQLHGELPPNIGIHLPNLQEFYGGANKFTGTIPTSLSNSSRLRMLDLRQNGLIGTLPAATLGRLQRLVRISFSYNRLESGKTGNLNFLSFLANCTSLRLLALNNNHFEGELPRSICNLSTQLKYLFLGRNLIRGSIPDDIGNLLSLNDLGMEENYLSGIVPDEIGKLQKLATLYLYTNRFSGLIPSSIGNLTSLTQLYMYENRFAGSIPPNIGNCQSLLELDLSDNNISGTIPRELVGISSLSISLYLSNNYLTGSLPSEVGDLIHLVELDVSGNKLSSEIPTTLGSCIMLVHLHLEGNEFEGTIPQSLKNLRSLEEIDISRNNLSGQIPEFLAKFPFLHYLNLSYNDFEGELPKEGIFSNASGLSVIGNNRLCGGLPKLRLHACCIKKSHSSQRLLAPKVVIPISCALAFIIAMSCFIVARSKVNKSRGGPVASHSYKGWKSISYLELVQSTGSFSMDNLIGSGSFGSVYKGVLPTDGGVVAVKVLNLQQRGASKSFIDECKALRSIRHRNLVKIITACSSIDTQGNDFKGLVFEFMENGSLDSWLHPRDDEQSQSKRLSLIQRLNIAIDVASALEYIHHHCETTIVHCDLKPSNVLLGEDMVAHVGDFGLARFLLEASENSSQSQTMSAALKGSIGYIPPEYGMGGQVSIMGDIYSFGILLLEMFIGKRPTDDMFTEGLSIHQFTAMAMPDHAMDIVYPSLLMERDDADGDDERYNNDIRVRPITINEDGSPIQLQATRLEECLVSVMQIGLSCSAISPSERMQMGVVIKKMKATKDSYLSLRRRRRRRRRSVG
ncbi:probable LRR receptor-like serine/threonine-protein kinase At3g47570 [Prunus avium]|uniref:non-specific serine/threonine protein kinase n=1 Tax=Prunus avium TaxID=42229 RepID=A0A6P5RG23_PRUAV|nr:probable LRR receptor-like serine/threonine-protein kinase At3g47570 [Prunus avium]